MDEPCRVAELVDRLFGQPFAQQGGVARQAITSTVQAIDGHECGATVELCFTEHVRQNGNEEIDAGNAENAVAAVAFAS